MAMIDRSLHCSFCGKDKSAVKKLVAGPTAFICNDCVDICIDIIRTDVEMRGESLDDFLPIMTGKTIPPTFPKHQHH